MDKEKKSNSVRSILKYKNVNFDVFWNQNDTITIQQGGHLVAIHPLSIGLLYGMLKDVVEQMEEADVDLTEIENNV